MDCTLRFESKKFLPHPKLQRFSSLFSCGSLKSRFSVGSHATSHSVAFPGELLVSPWCRVCGECPFPHMASQFPTPFVKKTPFSAELTLHFCQNSVVHVCVGLSWTLCQLPVLLLFWGESVWSHRDEQGGLWVFIDALYQVEGVPFYSDLPHFYQNGCWILSHVRCV